MGDTFYWGRRGSGKTLGAIVFEAWLDWLTGAEIWTNMKSISPYFDVNTITRQRGNLHVIDALDLIGMLVNKELPEDIASTEKPKTLILDEIKTQANAKNFMSYINTNLTNFVSQARKRNFKLVYTDQILGAYDRWIRLMTDRIRRCLPITNARDIGWGTVEYPEPIYFQFIELDLTEEDFEVAPKTFTISRQTARQFYPLYKTREMITPIELAHPELFVKEDKE